MPLEPVLVLDFCYQSDLAPVYAEGGVPYPILGAHRLDSQPLRRNPVRRQTLPDLRSPLRSVMKKCSIAAWSVVRDQGDRRRIHAWNGNRLHPADGDPQGPLDARLLLW